MFIVTTQQMSMKTAQRYDDTNLIHALDNLLANIALLLRSDTLPFAALWSGIIHDV